MGLDTYLIKRINKNNKGVEETVAYWRKCYGLDAWLSSRAGKVIKQEQEQIVKTKLLKQQLKAMRKYMNKLIDTSNQIGYVVNNIEDLSQMVSSIEDYGEDYKILEKIITTYSYDGLDIDVLSDSIWSSLWVFVYTYIQFQKAVKYPMLTLISSY